MSVASHLIPQDFRAPARPLRIVRANAHPHTADAAQARLFEELLLAEIAELQQLSTYAELKRQRRQNASGAPSDGLLRVAARLDEAQRLLKALQQRFPSY